MEKIFIRIVGFLLGIDYYNKVSKKIVKTFDKTVIQLEELNEIISDEQNKRRKALENIQFELDLLQQDKDRNERIRDKIKYLIE